MNKRLMIIVTGAPGTGKTTLSRKLSERYSIPIIAKDEIKELLFDSIGIGDRQWSLQLSKASYNLLFNFIAKLLMTNNPFIVEGNFYNGEATENFLKIKSHIDFIPLQIHCYTEPEILYQRYKARDNSGERHLGHIHQLPEFSEYKKKVFDSKCYRLDINQSIYIDLDTTHFESANYESLFNQIEDILNNEV
jgi:cytidylate kinase